MGHCTGDSSRVDGRERSAASQALWEPLKKLLASRGRWSPPGYSPEPNSSRNSERRTIPRCPTRKILERSESPKIPRELILEPSGNLGAREGLVAQL